MVRFGRQRQSSCTYAPTIVWRNPRPEIAPGIATLREKGLLVKKLDSELNENSPPVSETADTLSRIRSTPKPNLMACVPRVNATSSYPCSDVQWKTKLDRVPRP